MRTRSQLIVCAIYTRIRIRKSIFNVSDHEKLRFFFFLVVRLFRDIMSIKKKEKKRRF